MKSKAFTGCVGLLVFTMSSLGDPRQQDTTVPNRFAFAQAEYVVAEDAGSATITVLFYPGNRGMSGSVGYTTQDGTAIAGEDYAHTEGGLYFPGPAPLTFNVPVIWDAQDEGDQIVHLRLGGPDPQPTATLRITNVRRPEATPAPVRRAAGPARNPRPPFVTLNVTERTAAEGEDGAAALVVRRSNRIENDLRVFYRVTGTARNGADYERLEGSVLIPAGSNEATIEIIPLDDGLRERTERVAVQLKPAPRKYRSNGAQRRVVEIVDNDQP
jgi:hypothetical protein